MYEVCKVDADSECGDDFKVDADPKVDASPKVDADR